MNVPSGESFGLETLDVICTGRVDDMEVAVKVDKPPGDDTVAIEEEEEGAA